MGAQSASGYRARLRGQTQDEFGGNPLLGFSLFMGRREVSMVGGSVCHGGLDGNG